MYNSVFEVSHAPIPVSQRIRAGHLPDWFYEQVCDYTENLEPEQRQIAIEQFVSQFGGLCVREGDMITISPQIRETYFRKSYGHFKAAAETLSQTDYKAFSKCRVGSVLLLALDRLNNSYEDKRGVYICLTESGELMPLDRWIRTANFSNPFYIGGTISFHC